MECVVCRLETFQNCVKHIKLSTYDVMSNKPLLKNLFLVYKLTKHC